MSERVMLVPIFYFRRKFYLFIIFSRLFSKNWFLVSLVCCVLYAVYICILCLTSPPSFIRISLGVPAEGDTRLRGMRNMPVLHAPLHPNDGNAEPAIAVHGAGSQLVRNHMLSRFCGTRTRMAGQQNLLVPLTLLKIILSISACPHIFCLSSLLSIHTVCVRR